MNVRTAFGDSLKVLALTICYFICFVIATALVPLETGLPQSQAEQSKAAFALIVVCLLNTIVLTYIVLNSRWTGWKLIAGLFLILYGVTTVMPQSESAFFLTKLPAGMVPRLFVSGAIIAVLFSFAAIFVLGKRKQIASNDNASSMLIIDPNKWPLKLTIAIALYVTLYFTFGYFIAWKNPVVRAYYGGTDPGSFLTQMYSTLRDMPSLLPFQIIRGLIWTVLGLITISMMKGHWWKIAMATAALFGVVMNTQLLLPNPFMPEEVRMTHLVETATSNFIFGFILVWLFHRRSVMDGRS